LPKNNKIYFVYFIIAICFSLAMRTNNHGLGLGNFPFQPQVAKYIKQNNISGKVFSNPDVGSYLSFELYPNILVYADTRDDLYIGTSVVNDYFNVISNDKNIMPLISKYNPSIIVADLESSSYEPLLYDNNWALIYLDDLDLVFVKKTIADTKHLKQYVAIDPYKTSGSKISKENQAISEYKDLLSLQPNSANFLINIALAFEAQHDYSNAILTAHKIILPNNSTRAQISYSKNYLLASSYLYSRDCNNSKIYIDNYHNDSIHRFIFFPFTKVPGSSEDYFYMVYYSMCKKDYNNAQQYLTNYLNDSTISLSQKKHAQNIFDQVFNVIKITE